MAGVVYRAECVKPFGAAPKRFIERQLVEVKAADKHVGLEPFGDIYYAPVRAAAYQDPFAVLLNKKLMLVAEIIGHKPAVLFHIKPE